MNETGGGNRCKSFQDSSRLDNSRATATHHRGTITGFAAEKKAAISSFFARIIKKVTSSGTRDGGLVVEGAREEDWTVAGVI